MLSTLDISIKLLTIIERIYLSIKNNNKKHKKKHQKSQNNNQV